MRSREIDLLQQGGFSGSQKSRENGDGQSFVLNSFSHNMLDITDDGHGVKFAVKGFNTCSWVRRRAEESEELAKTKPKRVCRP